MHINLMLIQILSQNVVCTKRIRIVYVLAFLIQSSLYPVFLYRFFCTYSFCMRSALTAVCFILPNHSDPVYLQFVFQHCIDLYIGQTVQFQVYTVSEVFFFTDIPDISDDNCMDIIVMTVICNIPCHLVQIIMNTAVFLFVQSFQML